MNYTATGLENVEGSSRVRDGFRIFILSRLSFLITLDLLLRFLLSYYSDLSAWLAWDVILGTLNQLPIITGFVIFTAIIFKRMWRRHVLLMVIITFIDAVYVFLTFTSFYYFQFFAHFPEAGQVSRLGGKEIWATILLYILPRMETLFMLGLSLAVMACCTCFSIRKINILNTGRKQTIFASSILLLSFVPAIIINLSIARSADYYFLHSLASTNILFGSFGKLPGGLPPDDVIKRLRNQIDCEGDFVSKEYPLLKQSRRTSSHPELLDNGPPNIVMVVIESFASHNIGALESKYKVTPNFDTLVGKGLLFPNIRNYFSSTTMAEVNMLSSQWFIRNIPDTFFDHKMLGLPHVLKDNGYTTATWFHTETRDSRNRTGSLRIWVLTASTTCLICRQIVLRDPGGVRTKAL